MSRAVADADVLVPPGPPPLRRSLGLLGLTAIVLSAVTPASSLFTIMPATIAELGTGAFLAFAAAAAIGVSMAFCWSELGSAFPHTGGDYAIVARVLGPFAGFVDMVQYVLVGALIPAVLALGIADFTAPAFSADARVLGVIGVVAATVVAVLGIRLNAWVTGVFLAIELLALAVLVVLGFANAEQPLSTLTDPTLYAADGSSSAVTTSALIAGVAIAVFALNGYGAAVQFGEEITGSRRTIARAVLWALGITAVAEALPLVAVLVGTPSLPDLVNAANPFSYFIVERGGDTLNTIMSLAVAGAVFNALIAIQLELGRGLFSAGRDRAFPSPLNRAFASVHPRHGTPWIATLALGAMSAMLVALVELDTLLTLTGAGLVVGYALIATSALVFRMRDPERSRHYRMPLWPAWPVVGIGACVLVFTQQTGKALLVTAIVLAVSALYYAIYLLPRSGERWVLVDVAHPDD